MLCGLVITASATAQRIDPSVNKLMVVLPCASGRRQQAGRGPHAGGKVTGEFDGENLTLEFAWFSFSAT